jgi:hypothetical protein
MRGSIRQEPAKSSHLSISPIAGILSGLSLRKRIDNLDEQTMNHAVTAHQHVLRILIEQTDRSGEQLLGVPYEELFDRAT